MRFKFWMQGVEMEWHPRVSGERVQTTDSCPGAHD